MKQEAIHVAPKAGDRSSRHAGTPAGMPGNAGVSGNPKPGPHMRHSDLPANGLGPAAWRSQFLIHHESQPINGSRNRSRIRRVSTRRFGRPIAIHLP